MTRSVESIEISRFDPNSPILSPEPERRPFEIKSVGVFAVLKPEGKFYVAVWSIQDDGKGYWSLPAGRVDPEDASPLAAAFREFGEETNGGFDTPDITHMGIVARQGSSVGLARSLILRARIDLLNFGIQHSMLPGQTIRVAGDKEAKLVYFFKVGELLPDPVYRPEINQEVIKAFSQIKD